MIEKDWTGVTEWVSKNKQLTNVFMKQGVHNEILFYIAVGQK